MTNANAPRVRFAPSPTGTLHIGGARTALFNYLFARHHQGTMVLRIEDTDLERSTPEALAAQIRDLNWLGIQWDEGISAEGNGSKGTFGPYRQSERLDIYQTYVTQLLEQGQAYYCFLTEEEIALEKARCIAAGKPFRPSSPYRTLPLAEAKQKLASGAPAVIRLKAPDTHKTYTFNDLVRGTVSFSTEQSGDFVIIRTNGMPMYNFCCVIDDALMKISHVFRGEEHLPNTLRQLMLYDALQFTPPQFAHTSVILGPSGKKLSKRDGAAACEDFRKKGYLPNAMLNYIALLGWNDGTEKELFTQQELIKAFSVAQLNTAAPVFDPQKLTWMNEQHLRQLDAQSLWRVIASFMNDPTLHQSWHHNWGELFAETFSENFQTLQDAEHYYQLLCQPDFDFDQSARDALDWPTTAALLQSWLDQLHTRQQDHLDADWLNDCFNLLKQKHAIKGKQLFMPLRIAMIGQAHGAELKALIALLPKHVLIERAKQCLKAIGAHK